MSAFDTLAAFNSLCERKALVGAMLVADYSAAPLTKITKSDAATPPVVDLDPTAFADYKSLGKLTTDGTNLSGTVNQSQILGWGDAYPSRIDVTSESLSMTVSGLETNKETLDAFYNVDLSGTTPDATTSEVTFDKPKIPELRDKRVCALFRDVNKANGLDVFIGVHFLRANVVQNGDQTFANNDTGLVYPLSITALLDDAAGTAFRYFMGGPGMAALAAEMGWTA
ncbi:MAG TPA: hypothetical protein VFJ19_17375 [Nocardioidaceae bacterium]|nr:hypothetical protein [Nocardioidaceae bacterium]